MIAFICFPCLLYILGIFPVNMLIRPKIPKLTSIPTLVMEIQYFSIFMAMLTQGYYIFSKLN